MQDRFRFRVWNKEEKEMIYNAEFAYDGINYYSENFIERNNNDLHICCFGEYLEDKNYAIMQSTGRKDKNGKLIYESDIVKYEDEVYGLCIGKIEWDNAHYELQYYTGEKYEWFSHILCLKHIKNIEVIGNIYENKSLLESEG